MVRKPVRQLETILFNPARPPMSFARDCDQFARYLQLFQLFDHDLGLLNGYQRIGVPMNYQSWRVFVGSAVDWGQSFPQFFQLLLGRSVRNAKGRPEGL